LRLEHLLCGDALACEGQWCGSLAFLLGFHLLYWRFQSGVIL
jgi:hypothetical protein